MTLMKKAPKEKTRVPFWRTDLGDLEAEGVRSAIVSGKLSQGAVTREFEREFAASIGVPHAVATLNGTIALYLAASALGIGEGDEVIVPARTFVATAHAMMLAGATVKLVDCPVDNTLIDVTRIEAAITPKTKAIVPVHLNGNGCDMNSINAIARQHNLLVLEDAAQAFYSHAPGGFMGTLSDAGAFSLGVTKFITTGQGGMVVTHRRDVYDRMVRFRNQGVFDTFDATFTRFGFNLKFNDMLSSIGLVQLRKLEEKRIRHLNVYNFYKDAIADIPFLRLVPVQVDDGCLPLWVEVLSARRNYVIDELNRRRVQCRPFLPSLSSSPHLEHNENDFPNAVRFARSGMFLPCGPDLPEKDLKRTIRELRDLIRDVPEVLS